MANRRMVNIRIIDSDNFLDLPLSSQALYFHLLMRADDDGFINNPKRIQRLIGGSEDDFKLLVAKKYIITFESGVIVIKHWRMHNYIKPDRYKETINKAEKQMLYEDQNKSYTLENPKRNQIGTKLEPNWNHRLGKDSLGKDSLNNNILPEESGQYEQAYKLLLKDGTEYTLTENDVQKLEQLYPEIDVKAEIRKMIGWLDASPERRKTRRGIKRFVNGWLTRAYDALQKSKSENKTQNGMIKPNNLHNFEQRDYDFDALEKQLLQKQLQTEGQSQK